VRQRIEFSAAIPSVISSSISPPTTAPSSGCSSLASPAESVTRSSSDEENTCNDDGELEPGEIRFGRQLPSLNQQQRPLQAAATAMTMLSNSVLLQ